VLAGQHAIDLDTRYRGRVVDSGGAPLPGVDVTCVARGDAQSKAKTDNRGEYVLTSRDGVCGRLRFELSGFVPEAFASPGGDVLECWRCAISPAESSASVPAARGSRPALAA
jgi:hypothetical protein